MEYNEQVIIKFAPFGVGIHSMDARVAKEKGMKALKKLSEVALNVTAVGVGLSIMAAEAGLRHTSNGLAAAANGVADIHDGMQRKVSANLYLLSSTRRTEEKLDRMFGYW